MKKKLVLFISCETICVCKDTSKSFCFVLVKYFITSIEECQTSLFVSSKQNHSQGATAFYSPFTEDARHPRCLGTFSPSHGNVKIDGEECTLLCYRGGRYYIPEVGIVVPLRRMSLAPRGRHCCTPDAYVVLRQN